MYKDSKIISLVYGFGDMVYKASKGSYFCRFTVKIFQSIKNIWRNSLMGQVVDSFFNLEVQRNSICYRLISKFITGILDFFNNTFSLDQAISESKYFALINYSGRNMVQKEKEEGNLKTILMDSFYIKSIYEFWNALD